MMGDLLFGIMYGCVFGGVICTVAVTAAMAKRCEDLEERTQVYMKMAHRFRIDYARIQRKICTYIGGLKEIYDTIPPLTGCEYMEGQLHAANEILRMVEMDESENKQTDRNESSDQAS